MWKIKTGMIVLAKPDMTQQIQRWSMQVLIRKSKISEEFIVNRFKPLFVLNKSILQLIYQDILSIETKVRQFYRIETFVINKRKTIQNQKKKNPVNIASSDSWAPNTLNTVYWAYKMKSISFSSKSEIFTMEFKRIKSNSAVALTKGHFKQHQPNKYQQFKHWMSFHDDHFCSFVFSSWFLVFMHRYIVFCIQYSIRMKLPMDIVLHSFSYSDYNAFVCNESYLKDGRSITMSDSRQFPLLRI